jgi:hypothetical protein
MSLRVFFALLVLSAVVGVERAVADGGHDAADAAVIDANPYLDQGTTTGKGNDALLLGCLSQGGDTAPDAWYELELTATSDVTTWTTCESEGPASYDTRMIIYDEAMAAVACNDDDPACGAPYYQSRIDAVTLDPGTYYVVVDGFNGASGPYEIHVVTVEVGPPCNGSGPTNPTVIPTLPYADSGDLNGDCDDVLACELSYSGEDHWYQLTVDTPVFLDLATVCDGGDVATRVAVLDTLQNPLYCSDTDPACATGQSSLEDALLGAGTYFLVVDAEFTAGTYGVAVDTTHAPPGVIVDVLPDIICREDDLYDHDVTVVNERTLLRLSNATANVGASKLYLYGVTPANPDGTQDVMQRVWRNDGTFHDRLAGQFVYHPSHNHIHFEGWAIYRLREILFGGGVGPIVAEGQKTSFCVLDLEIYDDTLPGFSPVREFTTCSTTVQGMSIGWADIYGKTLSGQNIDVTDVPDGTYWLEAEVDPDGLILESDDTNNATRVVVTLGNPAGVSPDAFEPNDDVATVEGRTTGASNSPNLGPCGPQLVLTDLTLTDGEQDLYRFYMPGVGQAGDELRIDFTHVLADLSLELLDAAGTVITTADTAEDFEVIPLTGQPAGWYFARVASAGGVASPSYQLTVDPSANAAPSVAVLTPPAGNVDVDHGDETYDITWLASDPDGDPTWVTVYVNAAPQLDGNETLLPPSLHTDGSLGLHAFNTSYVPLGVYWVYCEITDGGTVTGTWSDGTITLYDPPTAADASPARVTRLWPNHPNPFNPSTVLTFELAQPGPVAWRIYDVRGALVRLVIDEWMPAGIHQRVWDGRDERGAPVASGVYFQAVDAAAFHARHKMVLLR